MYQPEGETRVALLELHLLVHGQLHHLSTHIEHSVDFFLNAVVLQTSIIRMLVAPLANKRTRYMHLLPKAKFSTCLPQLVDLGLITLLDESIINDEKRMCGDVLRERGELDESWHCV